MAITKLLRIKEAKSGGASSGLKSCLKYISNPEKTNMILTGGSSGGDPELTYSDMVSNKRSWGKENGTQGFHYIISFPPDEKIDIPTLRLITEAFCEELLKGEHLYAYAIHNDRDHLHSHICFDSISLTDGHTFHSGQYDWLSRIQPITDKICKKYGLPALDFDPQNRSESQNKYHQEWEKDNVYKSKKKVSWTDIIRSDVDNALSRSHSWQDFIQALIDLHYEVKDGTHLSLRPEGKERFTRSGRLGEVYTKENLEKRLGEPVKQNSLGDAEEILRALREFMQKTGQTEVKGIKVIYYQRWYAYSYVNSSCTPWKYRKELTALGKYTDRCAYLFKHDIATENDLYDHLQGLQEKQFYKKKELARVQNQIYNTPLSSWRKIEKLRAELDTASEVEKPAIQQQLSELIQPLRERDMMTESERYRSLQEKKTDLLGKQKQLKSEIVMATDLLSDFEKAKAPDDIMNDPDRYIPESFTEKSYQRITINKVLFRDSSEDSDFYAFKIPGKSDNVLIYKEDVKFASDGSYASCYLYDHIRYKVIDSNNKHISDIPGKEAMSFFVDRTREKVR